MSAPVSRRRFLGAALGVGAGAAAVAFRPWRELVRFVDPTAAGRLAGLFRDTASARAVGRRYLAGSPATLDRLTDDIAAIVPGGRRTILAASEARLREALAGVVRADFAADHVVDVDGWVLSVTEAWLYAIAALVERDVAAAGPR